MPESAPSGHGDQLSSEDAKLATLARAAQARLGSAEGAAVRDGEGRTYVAGTVTLRALPLSALQAAVAAAMSSGATSFEAAVVVSSAESLTPADEAVLDEAAVPRVLLVSADGAVTLAR